MWIHALALCKFDEVARTFHLPGAEYTTSVPDPDLRQLLQANYMAWDADYYLEHLLKMDPGHTHPHSQWISNLLLHYSWANRTDPNHDFILACVSGTHEAKTIIPLNVTLNRLLMWCIFLGSPIEEEMLRVQDKSYDISFFCFSSCSLIFTSDHMEPILDRLSKAILSAINGTRTQRDLISHMLHNLTKLETRPVCLTKFAYEWCSVICETCGSLGDWERLLVCLKIGFCHLDFQRRYTEAIVTHTEHYRALVDVVFETRESEAIVDLLHAWTFEHQSRGLAYALLGFCAGHLVGLHDLVPFSPRLRRLVIRSIELMGCEGFKGVGVEQFIELLNHLHVTAGDTDHGLH